MPLLHKAPYQFKSVPADLQQDDEVFHIRASKEIFKTYEEYISKAQLYTKEVWSCCLTGKSNLTLEEAIESETNARNRLEKFPGVLEKPTLLLAHHSNKNLDWMATTLTNQYKGHCAVGEIVTVSHNNDKKTGKVLECVTSLEADEGDDDLYSYKVMLLGTGEQVGDISHTSLQRKLQMPSKELIKMFIREHTTKQSNMFNVKKDMLVKYNIPHKFASITSVLRTPTASDRPGKKQMSKAKPSGSSTTTPKPSSATKPAKHTPKPSSATPKVTPKYNTPSSKPATPGSGKPKMIKIHSVGEDGRLVTTWKEIPQKPHIIVEDVITVDSDSDPADRKDDTPPISGKEKPKKPPLTDEQKAERKQKRAENKEIKEFTNKVQGLVEKYKDQFKTPLFPRPDSVDTPNSKMKQTSLLTYTNKTAISTTIREIIGAEENGYRRSMIINDLAKSMTNNVSDKLPLATPVKTLLLEKREKLLEKEKVGKMSPKKREDYYRQKEEMRIAELQKRREEKLVEQQKLKDERLRQREQERENARKVRMAQLALEKVIIDDLTIEDSLPLPSYIPIDLPEGHILPSFPKVALISDALHFFRDVFTQPEDDIAYNTDFLLQASLEGPRGHKALSNLMISMLGTLAQEYGDRIKVPELDVPFSTVDLNEFNVGASVVVYFRYLLQFEQYEGTELEEIVESLERQEFYDLTPHHKIHVLYVMCEEIIKTQTFNVAIQDKIERTTKARRQLQTDTILRNKQKQSDKLKQMQDALKKGLGGVVETVNIDSDKEDGEKEEDEKEESEVVEEAEEKEEEDGDEGIGSDEECISDLQYAVKKRREDVKRRKEEEEEERQRREADRIKEKKFREQQAVIINQRKKEEQLKHEIELLLQSVRKEPLGLDRNYAKYWLFSGTPGLYVEQGWWDTRYFSPIQQPTTSSTLNTSNNSEQSEDSGIQEKPQEVVVPPQCCAAWYVVPSLAHYEELKRALNKRGVREKQLLAALNKDDERIRTAIRKMNYPSRPNRFIGNVEATIKSLQKEIFTMDDSLGFAGLGGVENIRKILKQDLCSLPQFTEAMVAIQASVEAKYMKNPLSSIYNPSDLSFTYHQKVQVWKEIVESTGTYSQLHMLLSIFDNCVKWEKSIENIKCKVCKKKGDERKLLICDVCDTGYHCGCLRPPLKRVPEDEWQCPSCRPILEKQETSSDSGECSDEGEEDEDEEENDDYCCVCEYGGELILCDKCPSAYHLLCHDPPLKRIPRGDWACFNCQGQEEEEDSEEEEEDEDEEIENCVSCGRGGKLICCYECESTYHMRCHDPALKTVPGAKWKCSLCKAPEVTKSKSKKRSSTTSTKKKTSKKRKVEKSKPGPKKRLQSESEDRESETVTEEEEEEEEEEQEEEKPTRSVRSGRKSRSTADKPDSAAESTSDNRYDRSNRRSLKRGVDVNLEICEEIISDLLKIPESADFIDLVDKKKVPDYYDLIEKPVCLSQVKEKTLYLQYDSAEEFVEEVFTLIDNCYEYNLEQSEVYENGQVLEKSFLNMLKSRLPAAYKTHAKSRKSPK